MLPFPTPNSKEPTPFHLHADSKVTDPEYLIRQAFELDARQGYELLFRRYYRPLCSHAVRFVYSRELACDIVSEIFLNFWKNQAHLHITGSFRAYLFTSVRNRVYNYTQEEWKKSMLLDPIDEELEQAVYTDDDPQKILLVTELYQRLEQAIRSLSPQCQRVFLLSRFENKKHREIADELHISLKTVEAHLMKALSHLRKALIITGLLFSAIGLY
ncbi:RNA polymerase sigma-70 factor [Larkinella insperata]|uniref:RNA polymerase sigma-70 factor n=1 Tax=Larkinella insperata TaxID=332158 RepID=A0ABW3Q986_9BACT|nr:RNA polymerase sigma-70 factor [Larkinella insperata]